jgi:ribonuclease R
MGMDSSSPKQKEKKISSSAPEISKKHGDRVVASRSIRRRKKGSSDLEKRHIDRQQVHEAKNYCYIIPEDDRILQEVFIPEGETKRARPNQIVVAQIIQYPAERVRPEGRITHILGYPDDPEVEPQIIIHKYDLPDRFSSAVLKELQDLPSAPSSHETKDRIDLNSDLHH